MRDCIRNLQATPKKLYHLGLKPVARSIFSDANNNRPAQFFQALFGETYRRCTPNAPKHKFRFKSKLMSLDSTRLAKRKLGVTSDQIVEIATSKGKLKLRRVGFKDQETGKHYKFLTNNFKLAAKTIADIYKERWKIELFFKEIKQNLKIKSVVGNSENAVLTQIYTALIVYLISAYIRFMSRIGMSVQQMLQLLQVNVFGQISLMELFKPPQKTTQTAMI